MPTRRMPPVGQEAKVKIDSKWYYLATGADGRPLFGSGTKAIEEVPSDEGEHIWEDWTRGIGHDYLRSNHILGSVKGQLVPAPILTELSFISPTATSTGTTATTMTDAGIGWQTGEWVGATVTMPGTPGGTMVITENTTDTLTGTAWSNAGDPADALNYTIGATGIGPARYYFEEVDTAGDWYGFYVCTKGIVKVALKTVARKVQQYTVAATSPFISTDRLGQPVKATDGDWYIPCNNADRIIKMTTPVVVDSGTGAGDTFTLFETVLKGAAHFLQLPNGKVWRFVSSHSAGSFSSRCEISIHAAGEAFETDANDSVYDRRRRRAVRLHVTERERRTANRSDTKLRTPSRLTQHGGIDKQREK